MPADYAFNVIIVHDFKGKESIKVKRPEINQKMTGDFLLKKLIKNLKMNKIMPVVFKFIKKPKLNQEERL